MKYAFLALLLVFFIAGCTPPTGCVNDGYCSDKERIYGCSDCTIQETPEPEPRPGTRAQNGTATEELLGACVIRDAVTDLPGYFDPDAGSGYAKFNLGGVADLVEATDQCTDGIYEGLTDTFCAEAPHEDRGQWEVAVYDQNGTWVSTGCSLAGCDFQYCVDEGCSSDADCDDGLNNTNDFCIGGICRNIDVGYECGNSACERGETCEMCPADCGACPAPACGDSICQWEDENCVSCPDDCGSCISHGICLIRDQFVDVPGWGDPAVGDGYVFLDLGPTGGLTETRNACNASVFESLMDGYCGMIVNDYEPIWEAAYVREVAGYPFSSVVCDGTCAQAACAPPELGTCRTDLDCHDRLDCTSDHCQIEACTRSIPPSCRGTCENTPISGCSERSLSMSVVPNPSPWGDYVNFSWSIQGYDSCRRKISWDGNQHWEDHPVDSGSLLWRMRYYTTFSFRCSPGTDGVWGNSNTTYDEDSELVPIVASDAPKTLSVDIDPQRPAPGGDVTVTAITTWPARIETKFNKTLGFSDPPVNVCENALECSYTEYDVVGGGGTWHDYEYILKARYVNSSIEHRLPETGEGRIWVDE